MHQPNYRPMSCLRTVIILPLVAFGFIALIVLLADIKCSYDIENWWAPLYPNGETVDVEYDLFRARALGVTTWLMVSDDEVETVKQFYRETRIATLRAEKTRGLAWSESYVQPLNEAIAAARFRYESISQELDAVKQELDDPVPPELEAEKAKALARLNALEKQLAAGAASLIIISSACGT